MNIKELTIKSMKEENISHIPFSLFGKVNVINKSDGDRIISGYANLAVVDSQNQLIPVEVLKAGMETLLSNPVYANLMLVHKNIQIGQIIESYGDFKTHVDDKGAYIVCRIRKDIVTANKVWEQILKGELNGFSIGCEVLDDHDKCDIKGENCIEVLDKINIFEVSICSFPINEMSGFVVISKSKYESDVCNDCKINNDNMKKKMKSDIKEEKEKFESSEIKDETNVETKEENAVLSVEERMESVERTIFNIEAALTKLAEPKEEEDPEKEEEDEKEKKSESSEEKSESEPEKTDGFVEQYKKDYDELKKSISEVSGELTKAIEKLSSLFSEEKEKQGVDELKMAVKARDDQIDALKKKNEILSKSDVDGKEPKTVNKSEDELDDIIETYDDDGIFVKDGTVSRSKLVY